MGLTLIASTVWCALVFIACIFVIPAWRSHSCHGVFDRLSRGGLAAGAFWVCAACVMGSIKCYNAITGIAAAAGAIVVARNMGGMSLRAQIIASPEQAIGAWNSLLAWSSRSHSVNMLKAGKSRWIARQMQLLEQLPATTLSLLALIISVIVLSICSHLVHWNNIRLVHADEYLCLLRARQLLLNVDITAKPLLFPTLVSASALLSGSDPLHAVRALAALMPVLVILATGRVAFLLTHSLLASSVAMYCENVALVRLIVLPLVVRATGPQPALADLLTIPLPNSLESEAAIFFLLLWMGVLLKKGSGDRGIAWSSAACGIVLTASSFLLLLLAPFVGLACVGRRPGRALLILMTVIGLGIVTWQMRNLEEPIEALQYLPCILGLMAAMIIARLELLAVWSAGMQARPVLAAVVVALALIRIPPATEVTQALEYDSIARATNAISHQFTHQRWSIAAPVEQFAEVYSLGGFQDLAALVNASSSGDISQPMMGNDGWDDLFIFVEKMPFTPFSKEPTSVSFVTLTDSTYRNYRSPAGRASLEVRAMQLCEAYKKNHKNMTVFFEDENVRVYRLNRIRDPSGTG
jgi:hypothetical protein